MLSNTALIAIVILITAIAQFSPLTALLLSITLTAYETSIAYVTQNV